MSGTEVSYWNPRLHLSQMYTPLERCVSVRPGKIDPAIIEELRRQGYDQAPVLGSDHGAIGVVLTGDLERLVAGGRDLGADDPAIDSAELPVDVSLVQLLKMLSSRRACLVAVGEQVSGLLTISDLNKHAFRVALYTILSALEVALARLIERNSPEPDRWLPKLSRDDQVRILGFWEVTKRFGVDTGPLAGCTLTQLVRIVAAVDELWRELGYGTASKARASLDRLPPFRNKIMHPVRPLILRSRDVAEIKQAVDRILGISPHLEGWLDAHPG